MPHPQKQIFEDNCCRILQVQHDLFAPRNSIEAVKEFKVLKANAGQKNKSGKLFMIGTVYTDRIKPVADCSVWSDDEFCSQFNLSVDVGGIMMASNSCGRTWNCRRPFDTLLLLDVEVSDTGRDDSSVARLWIRCSISRVDRVWSAQDSNFSTATSWNRQFSVALSAATDA